MVNFFFYRYNINMKLFRRTFIKLVLLSAAGLALFSCKSTEQEDSSVNFKSGKNQVSFVFLGDIMAHTGNFRMKNYDIIWDDIRDVTSSSDFTFANVEAPVCDDHPFQNYPNFNMQYSYPQAAIDAGINVITTANNHTNDQFEHGIFETSKWTKTISEKYKDSARPVYFSGLKQDVSSIEAAEKSGCSYAAFEKNGIKVLFLGATQLLNSPSCNQMINYFPGTTKAKKSLIKTVTDLKKENPCDVFVLALHTEEPEYVLTVTEDQRKFYLELLDAGVDILWANHPHTPKPVEYFGDKKTEKITKAIFYATGNTISSQRFVPNFKNPHVMREYTGDGFCIRLMLKKEKDSVYIQKTELNFITTFVDSDKNILIKKLNQDLIDSMEQSGLKDWKDYYIKRESLLKELKETTTWQ